MQLTKHWAASLDDYVIDLAWSPDGAQLAAGSAAGPITIFAATDGASAFVLPGHDGGSNCLAWRPQTTEGSTRLLATGGQDGKVKFWDAAAGQHVGSTELEATWIEHLSWRPLKAAISDQLSAVSSESVKQRVLLAAAAGRQLVLLAENGIEVHRFKPAPKTISAIAWQPAGGCIASAYFGGVALWDADDFVAQKEFPYANGIHALVWSPDSKWLVSGNQDPSVHLWMPEQNEELHMSGYEGKVKELSFDHTSRWLATGGGKDACVWDCSGKGPEGRDPRMLPHDAKVCAVAFQHHHGLLATASQDGALMLWSPERQQPLRATVRMPHPASKIAWSPDDQLLAIGSENGTMYVLKCEP